MELRTLRYFITVAEELNITRAAQRLMMSQPPLSHQMQLLEEELGAQLFIRGKRHLQLTDEGTLLLRRARQMLELEEKTKSEIQELKNGISGTLYLAMVEGRAPYLAARWITGFQQEYPNVRFNLWNGSTDATIARLTKGLADFALVATPYNTELLEGIVVGDEPWVAIISTKNPLSQLPSDTIEPSQLVGQPLIVPARSSRQESIREWFQKCGAEPNFVAYTSNYMDGIALSEQNAGITIFPRTTRTPNRMVVTKEIRNPSWRAEYVLTHEKGHSLSPLAEEFLNYVKDYLQEHPNI